MACRICATLLRWAGLKPEVDCDAVRQSHWQQSDDWEWTHSNQDELRWRDTEPNRALIDEAFARQGAEPEAAFRLFEEAAAAGSPVAMTMAGSYHECGIAVTADLDRAADYYHRAICAGSWLATIRYARLLAAQGHVQESEDVLRDGVRLDFVPAFYWLAQLRYERAQTRAVCREIRPLLDHAAARGHPGAKQLIGTLMTKGKYGLLAIPKGLRLLRQTMPPILRPDKAEAAERLKRRALEAAAS